MKSLTVAEALNQALKTFRKNYDGDLVDDLDVRWNAEDLIADEWPQYKDKPFRTVWDDEGDNPAWSHLTVKFLGCKTFDDDVYQYSIDILEEIRNGTPTATTKAGDQWATPGKLALSWPDLDATARLVLLALTSWANNKGGSIFPSQKTVARLLELDPQTVKRAMRRLRDGGVIEVTAEARQHTPPIYKIMKGPRVV